MSLHAFTPHPVPLPDASISEALGLAMSIRADMAANPLPPPQTGQDGAVLLGGPPQRMTVTIDAAAVDLIAAGLQTVAVHYERLAALLDQTVAAARTFAPDAADESLTDPDWLQEFLAIASEVQAADALDGTPAPPYAGQDPQWRT